MLFRSAIPEQAAVWSYPTGSDITPEEVSPERIAVNMINSFLGRMHLAGNMVGMTSEQLDLIKEGVRYYETLTEAKKKSVPYFPLGFTGFGEDCVAAGFKTEDKIYLAVWCLQGAKRLSVPIDEGIRDVWLSYPSSSDTTYTCDRKELCIEFTTDKNAAFFEIDY